MARNGYCQCTTEQLEAHARKHGNPTEWVATGWWVCRSCNREVAQPGGRSDTEAR